MLEERHDEEKQGKKTTSHLVIIKTAEILSKSRCSTLCSRPWPCYIFPPSAANCIAIRPTRAHSPVNFKILRFPNSIETPSTPSLPPRARSLMFREHRICTSACLVRRSKEDEENTCVDSPYCATRILPCRKTCRSRPIFFAHVSWFGRVG